MAYAAVVSLKHTIHRLLNSSHIPIISSTRDTIQFAYEKVNFIQQLILKRSDHSSSSSKRLDALDGEIREAVQRFEDLLEFHVSDLFSSPSESYGDDQGGSNFHIPSLDLDQVMGQFDVNFFAEMAKKLEENGDDDDNHEINEEEEDDDDDEAAASSDVGEAMVGFWDNELMKSVKNEMVSSTRPFDFCVYSIVGVTGTGRTHLARRVFDQSLIRKEQSFDCGAWVTIGPSYQSKNILLRILALILPQSNHYELHILSRLGDETIAERLYAALEGRKYMIVLDDVCDTKVWDDLKSSFPRQDNGSLILLTSSHNDVAIYAGSYHINHTTVLDREDVIWNIFQLVMFGFESRANSELEEAGRKIVSNCGGLTIPLFKVILYLWNADRTPQCWNRLADDTNNSVFFMVTDELSEMSEIVADLCNLLPDDVEVPQTLLIFSQLLENGFSIEAEFIKKMLFPTRFLPKMKLISFIGMAGIGKTTFVKSIFNDPQVLHHFHHQVWMSLGPKYRSEDILVDILAQIYPRIDKIEIKTDADLAKDLCTQLSNKKCLIVLDNVRNKDPLHHLKTIFPDIKGTTLATSRLAEVALSKEFDHIHELQLLNKQESWSLLLEKVFGKESCPYELEKAGKKIAENCDGLPLTIVTVANFLCQVEKTSEYWNNVAERKDPLFINAYYKISKTLLPSYKNLPQHLKPCVLYMGLFPQNYEIPTSILINLWIAERFLEQKEMSQTEEEFGAECLLELIDRSLLMVCQKSSNFRIKTCRLHSTYWHLCNDEALKNMFFHAFNTHNESIQESTKKQRRLCIRNNMLFAIEEVNELMRSMTSVHSVLCTGPLHPYPVPICLNNYRLLRVLKALTLRFYEFPLEVLKLIHLTYLALTCNGNLLASISKLQNLHFLIISRSSNIKSFGAGSSYLPMEIWDMKELKHLQVTGSNLPIPMDGTILPNLVTLLDVNADGCTEEVFNAIPNLKRLGVQFEQAPDDEEDDGITIFHCFNHISTLSKLESLKCVVVNPELRQTIPKFGPIFPPGLKKLSLSGLQYPWEYMSSVIGKLRNLQVLKLRCYAFRGKEWETGDREFVKLKYLSIEDTDLVRWKRTLLNFVELKHLSIKHCYELEELPNNFMSCVEKIEVVDCNPYVVSWAKQIVFEQKKYGYEGHSDLKPEIQSSWDSAKPQLITARRFEETITSKNNEMNLQVYDDIAKRWRRMTTVTDEVQAKEEV